MSFTVNAAGLAGLPDQLDRLQQDAFRGSAYVGDHATLSYGGVLNDITADHERTLHDVRGFLDKLGGPVAGNAADAVRAATTWYAHADAKAAASLDATCPATTSAHADVAGNYGATSYSSSALGARFRDVARPTDHYLAPPDRHGEYPDEPLRLDVISPSATGRQLIIKATELAEMLGLGHRWDPYEKILKPLTGDWNGLRACADVYGNVGGAVGDLSMNLRTMAYDVPEVWTGNAADGLTGYVLRVADQLDGSKQSFADLGSSYKAAAENAHRSFEQVGELLSELIDIVLLFIVEAVAAAASAETVVGPIALGAAAAVDALEMFQTIHFIEACLTAIKVGIEDLADTLSGSGAVNVQAKLPVLEPAHLQLPGDQSGVGKTKIGPAR
jgi:hypothetical protein